MIRPSLRHLVPVLAALVVHAAAPAGEPVQPVLLPQADLRARLDPSREWLFLPVEEWRRLVAAGTANAPEPTPAGRPRASLTGGVVTFTGDGRAISASATLEVQVPAGAPPAVELFATTPAFPGLLEALTVAGRPGLLIPGTTTVVLPREDRAGAEATNADRRWPLTLRWQVPAPADGAAGWSACLPLPSAAGLDVRLAAPEGWTIQGPGITADGPGRWRAAAAGPRLDVGILPAGGQAAAWGARQEVDVRLPSAAGGGTFTWRLANVAGHRPERLRVRLPAGFLATGPAEAVAADGSVLLTTGEGTVVEGLVSPGAALDLAQLDGARWQGGDLTVHLGSPARLTTPDGWIPLAEAAPAGAGILRRVDSEYSDRRRFAISRPGHGLIPEALTAVSGAGDLDLKAAAAAVVQGDRLRATWRLAITGRTPVHTLAVTMPAGWRVVAAEADGGATLGDLPPADELATAPWTLAVQRTKALAPGRVQALTLTLERILGAEEAPPQDPAVRRRIAGSTPAVRLDPPLVVGAGRTSHRIVLAADPGHDCRVEPAAGWRLGPPSQVPEGLDGVAELLAAGDVAPLALVIRPRATALTADSVCWLQPRGDDTDLGLDLHLTVTSGALDRIVVILPPALKATAGTDANAGGWRLETPGVNLTLGTPEGPDRLVLTWPTPWSGERVLRLRGRVAAVAGATAVPEVSLTGLDGYLNDVPVALTVAALAGDRVDVTARAVGRTLEPDELPAWASAPPGTRILAAWRPLTGAGTPMAHDRGGVTARTPHLDDGPGGFLDQVQIRTQVGQGGGLTTFTARLAAPGLTALPLRLPPGMVLEEALIDGATAAVRQDGATGPAALAVVLPGRTQVRLDLRLRHPAGPGQDRLELPGIDLPWLTVAWQVAVPPTWRAEPWEFPGGMPRCTLASPRTAARPWFAAWRPGVATIDEVPPLPTPAPTPMDPRLLSGPSVLPPAVATTEPPRLPLIGTRFVSSRLGAPTGLGLVLTDLTDLDAADRWGRTLGLVLAVAIASGVLRRRWAWWRPALLAGAAGAGSYALVLAQTPGGLLLGALESLTVLLVLITGVSALRQRVQRSESAP